MKPTNPPLQFTFSDYDRLLEWAKELANGNYYYDKADAALALKLKIMRTDFVSERNQEYKKKKCQENSTTMN